MVKRTDLRPDILEALWDQYCKVLKFQKVNNNITVTMSLDDYLSLWSKARIATIEKKIAKGGKALFHYFNSGSSRPVCGWVTREARVIGGTMAVADARIMKAEDSLKMFRFQTGDKHDDASKAKIGDAKRGVKQTDEHIQKRTQGQVGVKRGPMSEEAKAKLRATRAANNAARTAGNTR